MIYFLTRLEDHVTQVSRDDYSEQVDDLEKHTAELHTSVTSLEAQLKSSKQEAVRWRKLANDRLEAMNDLHKKYIDLFCDFKDNHCCGFKLGRPAPQ